MTRRWQAVWPPALQYWLYYAIAVCRPRCSCTSWSCGRYWRWRRQATLSGVRTVVESQSRQITGKLLAKLNEWWAGKLLKFFVSNFSLKVRTILLLNINYVRVRAATPFHHTEPKVLAKPIDKWHLSRWAAPATQWRTLGIEKLCFEYPFLLVI